MKEDIFLNIIGKTLSNQRQISEISLQELSAKTGIDTEKILEIEMGKIPLDLEEFLTITAAIGIDAAKIINEIH